MVKSFKNSKPPHSSVRPCKALLPQRVHLPVGPVRMFTLFLGRPQADLFCFTAPCFTQCSRVWASRPALHTGPALQPQPGIRECNVHEKNPFRGRGSCSLPPCFLRLKISSGFPIWIVGGHQLYFGVILTWGPSALPVAAYKIPTSVYSILSVTWAELLLSPHMGLPSQSPFCIMSPLSLKSQEHWAGQGRSASWDTSAIHSLCCCLCLWSERICFWRLSVSGLLGPSSHPVQGLFTALAKL